MGSPPVHAGDVFSGVAQSQRGLASYGKPWRDRQIPGQRCRAGTRDSESMMDQTSQKIRAITDRLRNLLVLLLK